MILPNFHVIRVIFLPITNNQMFNRVKMISDRFQQSKTVQIQPDMDTKETAIDWLTKNGFEFIGQAEGKDSYLLISTTFKPFRETK